MQFKARIKNLALRHRVSAQAVLQNFMLERLLERISISQYRDAFILKGGMLVASLVGIDHRTTMDMDTTLRGYPLSEELLRAALLDICHIELDDETTFTVNQITAIRDDEYGGYRVSITAMYESINTPLKVDVTTGDRITPDAVRYAFQSNFEDKTIEVWAYNIETVLAEKVETILRRSVFNTRFRDFYDVYIIMTTQQQAMNMETFYEALSATSQKRASLAAFRDSRNILASIGSDTSMKQGWERYRKQNRYAEEVKFDKVLQILADVLK
jgi:predicted nucleotidyltransferase component of viral defense system